MMTMDSRLPTRSKPFILGILVFAALPCWAAVADPPARSSVRSLHAPDGSLIDLQAPKDGVTVLVFYSSECPIANAYSPTLNRLAGEFPAGSVKMVGVCVDPDLSDADVTAHARDFDLKFPIVRDRQGVASARLGATVTPEAFVIDPKGRVRYHGRIDDQFAARQKRNANPKVAELRDAVADVLAGREVAVPHVEAVGCPIPRPPKEAAQPTFARDVASILQKNCQECHRRGQVGLFPLETFEQAAKRADDIAAAAEGRKMPPWKAAHGVGPRFKNDRSLSDAEVATLVVWAETGAPLGNPADMPSPPQFSDDWALGTPDLVLQTDDYAITAQGEDIYRCFVIPTDLPQDVYISAIEYRPGNHRVVHHMLGYVDIKGEARKKDEADPAPGYSCFSGPGIEIHGDFGGWAPGNEPARLPDGVGRALPRKSDVVVQIHYHPSGKAETDRSRIGLYFCRTPIKQTLHWSAAINREFVLQPGDPNVEVKAVWKVPVDVEAHAVTPHMHQLGRDMQLTVIFPDGRTRDLIRIDDWDFGWQNTYYFEELLDLPRGTVLKLIAHYDNSENNPRNPHHPPKVVRWGEGTTDEMCIGFIAITKKGQDLTRPGEKDDLREIIKRSHEGARKPAPKAATETSARAGN